MSDSDYSQLFVILCVRFGPLADVATSYSDVRFIAKAGHQAGHPLNSLPRFVIENQPKNRTPPPAGEHPERAKNKKTRRRHGGILAHNQTTAIRLPSFGSSVARNATFLPALIQIGSPGDAVTAPAASAPRAAARATTTRPRRQCRRPPRRRQRSAAPNSRSRRSPGCRAP